MDGPLLLDIGYALPGYYNTIHVIQLYVKAGIDRADLLHAISMNVGKSFVNHQYYGTFTHIHLSCM